MILKSLLVLLFVSAGSAFALDAPATNVKPFDLMKCTAPAHGSLLASFGRMRTSDKPEPMWLATEVAVFAPDSVSRIYEMDLKKAIDRVQISMREESASFRFTVEANVGSETFVRKHTVTIVTYDRRDKNSFLGNWKVEQEGVGEVNSPVACTLL